MKNDMILKAGGTVFNFVRKNLPTILSWTAAGGVIATAVTSAQASRKAEKTNCGTQSITKCMSKRWSQWRLLW